MFFSDYFEVEHKLVEQYGAIDISLVCDLPLFIDPMLIFNSEKKVYQKLHENIVSYFTYLLEKTKMTKNKGVLKAYFTFKEVKNTWLGYSKKENKGRGLGTNFANFLFDNLTFVVNTNSISTDIHIEKVLLLYDGNGKDKISDLTTNLILGYLAEYTQKFALKKISEKYLAEFPINYVFNFQTGSFKSKLYKLPFIINDKGIKEYVLLTPKDILRVEEPAISKKNFLNHMNEIRLSIENDALRSEINNYIASRLAQYIQDSKDRNHDPTQKELEREEKNLYLEAAKVHPELYDYFIKYVEKNGDKIEALSKDEVLSQLYKFFKNSSILISIFKKLYPDITGAPNSREELISRINYFKHCIEDCDCYKCFYDKNGVRISSEDDLQRYFRFVWYGTFYDVNYETNNGRGELDVKTSFGAKDGTIAEFKLASNTTGIKTICEQTKIYENANRPTHESIYVIFYFTLKEYESVRKTFESSKNSKKLFANAIFIDCRNDNKESGSKTKSKNS